MLSSLEGYVEIDIACFIVVLAVVVTVKGSDHAGFGFALRVSSRSSDAGSDKP